MPNAQELVQLAREGDQSAFRQLVETNQALVRSAVRGMLGDTPEAEDVAQEVFIRFYQALGNYRGEAQLSTYLCRIAINLSLNELKRRQRKARWLSVVRKEDTGWYAEGASLNPGREELRDALRKALQRLEPEFRAVVVLRLVEGYSVKETAEILELPLGTVASRLARGQEKLREILGKWL